MAKKPQIVGDQADLEDTAAAAEADGAAPETVRMTRDAEQYPKPPHFADVNVAEVDNWAKHGWVRCAD